VNNETGEPDEAHALWIMYRGREWVCLWNDSGFTLFPGDTRGATKQHADQVFKYLHEEGFINEDDMPESISQ